MTIEEARKELEKYGVEAGLLKVNFELSKQKIEEKLREMLEAFERLDEIEEELEELENEKCDLEVDLEDLEEDLKTYVEIPLKDRWDVLRAMKRLGIDTAD